MKTKTQTKHCFLPILFTTKFIGFMESFTFSRGRDKYETSTIDIDLFMHQVETYTSFKIASFIDKYWFPVLIPVGVVGNILSFLVMRKQNNRKMSTCIYMATISINDNLMMIATFSDMLVTFLKIHQWNLWTCKVASFCALFALQNSTFQIVAMTIDKYIAIKWPHRAVTYSTPRRARMITMGLSISVLIYNSPHFYLIYLVNGQCMAYGTGGLLSKIYSWFNFVLNAVIPFTLLIYMNFVIVKTVKTSRKMFRRNSETTIRGRNQLMDSRGKTMKSAGNQLTVMLLLVTTLFLILLCPTYVRFIYLAFAARDTPYQYANSMLIYQISFKLYSTNSGINFFLYCISGQKFRNDLKEILFCCHNSQPAESQLDIVSVHMPK